MYYFQKRWTGKGHIDKINELRNTIKQKDCYAVVLTALDDVACEFHPILIHANSTAIIIIIMRKIIC
jgi:hypothetical protein